MTIVIIARLYSTTLEFSDVRHSIVGPLHFHRALKRAEGLGFKAIIIMHEYERIVDSSNVVAIF